MPFPFFVPNVDLFFRIHVVKEASTSSKIEGTQTNIDEALSPKEFILPERRDDQQKLNEVKYIRLQNIYRYLWNNVTISAQN